MPAKIKKPKLPTPRLQLRWARSEYNEHWWECHYELVILLDEHDIRREVYRNGRLLAKKLPREYVVPIGGPTIRQGSGVPPCSVGDNRYCDAPYRDGAHAQWDSKQLGDPPIYVIAPDGMAFLVEKVPL